MGLGLSAEPLQRKDPTWAGIQWDRNCIYNRAIVKSTILSFGLRKFWEFGHV